MEYIERAYDHHLYVNMSLLLVAEGSGGDVDVSLKITFNLVHILRVMQTFLRAGVQVNKL